MATLADLLRGGRDAVSELNARGVVVGREGDAVEVCDPECRTLLGFQAGRAGVLVYFYDVESSSSEVLLVEDILVFESIGVGEVIDEDGRVKPPSIWIHVGDPGLRYTRGRICTMGRRVQCKSI